MIVLTREEEKRKKILQQYMNDILYRDIIYRHQIRDVRLLEAISYYYITNISSLHSFNRIRNVLGTSIDNVRRYSSYLEESFLLLLINRFSFKISGQQKSNQKVYAVDPGLRNQYGFRFSQDMGKLAENVVAVTLSQRSDRLYYYAKNWECDFIAQQDQDFIPLQISMGNPDGVNIRNRKMKGLLAALRYFKIQESTIITDDLEERQQIENMTVNFIPLWKFLINQ